MRPGQQNRRSRGRNSNRKGPNPLSRNFESNGPDVKIRGSAQHVAEKYTTLARDAQSSGDRVMGENYLQHAEHYNRIVAAAQAQLAQQAPPENRDDNTGAPAEDNRENPDNRENVDDRIGRNGREAQDTHNVAQPVAAAEPVADPGGSGPQPIIEGTPAEVVLEQESVNGGTRRPRRRSPSAESVPGDSDDAPKPATRAPRRSSRAARAPKPVEGETAAKPESDAPAAAGNSGSGDDKVAAVTQD